MDIVGRLTSIYFNAKAQLEAEGLRPSYAIESVHVMPRWLAEVYFDAVKEGDRELATSIKILTFSHWQYGETHDQET